MKDLRKFLPFVSLFFLLALIPTISHAQDNGSGGSGGGGSATVDRGSVTDLGGGAAAGAEPDIFDGVDDAGSDADSDAGADDSQADGDEGAEETADDDSQSDEGEEGAGEEGDEAKTEEEEDEDGDEEGKDGDGKGGDGKGKGKEKTPEEKAAEAAAKKKPLTKEEQEMERTLQEAYRNNPDLKAALKQFPKIRGEFFRAAALNKVFPGGQKEAEQAKTWATDLLKIDTLVFKEGGVEAKRDFVKMLYDECLDTNGKSTGHYEQIAEIMVSDALGGLEQYITQNPSIANQIAANLKPEQVSTAIEVIRRLANLANGRPLPRGDQKPGAAQRTAANAPDTTGMTPREKQLAEELAQAKTDLQRFNTKDSETAQNTFYGNVYKEFDVAVQTDLAKRIPSTIQSNPKLVSWFGKEVRDKMKEALGADQFFVAQLEQASRSGDRGQQHVSQLANMMKQRATMLLPAIARQVAAEFAVKPAGSQPPNNRRGTPSQRGSERPRREPGQGGSPGRLNRPAARGSAPARRSGVSKTTGDYNSDANKLLGLDEE